MGRPSIYGNTPVAGIATASAALTANQGSLINLIANGGAFANTGFFFLGRSVGSDASAAVGVSATVWGWLTNEGFGSLPVAITAVSNIHSWSNTIVSSGLTVKAVTSAVTVLPAIAINVSVSNTNTDSAANVTLTAGLCAFGF